MPRPISTTTRPGRLRNLLNIGIKEFAEVSGLSTHTIRSIECGREPLSRQAAEGISFGTGVDTEWLLGAGRKNCPTTLDLASGQTVPFTPKHYRYRTEKNLNGSLHPLLDKVYHHRCWQLLAFLRAAERVGKAAPALYLFRRMIDDSIDKLESFPAERKRLRDLIGKELQKECEAEAERQKKQRWIEERALTGPVDEPPAEPVALKKKRKA